MSDNTSGKHSNIHIMALLLVIAGVSFYSIASLFSANSKAIEVSVLQNIRLAATPSNCNTCPPIRTEQPPSESKTIPKETPTSTTKPETKPPVKPRPQRPYTPPEIEIPDEQPLKYTLPELTPEQKKLEEKDLNPYRKTEEVKEIKIEIDPVETEQEVKQQLEKVGKAVAIDTDGETIDLDKNTTPVVALTFQEAKERRAKLKKDRLKNKGKLEKETLIITPASDSDGDGITDTAELKIYKTDPFDKDSDSDGLSDAEEVLEFGSDPLKSSTPDFTPRVTNLDNNKVPATPLLKGVANPGEKVSIEAKNIETDETKVICETTADGNGKFLCIPDKKVADGNYYIYSNHEAGENDQREIARIKVEGAKAAEAPKAEVAVRTRDSVMANIDHTKDWLTTLIGNRFYDTFLSKKVETVSDQDKLEKLVGQAEPGQIIIITWKSLLLSSTVIADASQGDFELLIPKALKKGNHTVYIYAYNPTSNFLSKIRTIIFSKS